MTTNYHLTVTTTGLTSQQVRWTMDHFGWQEVYCHDFIDRDRQFIRWHGVGSPREDTAEAHATLVDAFLEHAGIFTVKTTWKKEIERCPDCFQPVKRCMCDLLSDNSLDDPEEDGK